MQKEIVKVNDKNVLAVEWNGERVITTAQLADVYDTDMNNVQANFNRNKERFVSGRHYIFLQGEELKEYKRLLTDSQHPLAKDLKFVSQLYLWTRRGASRHCKILDTEKAWEQFDCLEENYFNPKHNHQSTITYQYPLPAATFEGAANLGRLIERVMRSEGACPHEIATVLRPIFQQAGIEVRECFVKLPAYEQLTLDVVTR